MEDIDKLDSERRWIVLKQSQAKEPRQRYGDWYMPRYEALICGRSRGGGAGYVIIDDRLIRFDNEYSKTWPEPNIETLLFKQQIKWSYIDPLLENGAMSVDDIVEELVNGDIVYVARTGDCSDFETVWFPESMRARADAFKLMYGCD